MYNCLNLTFFFFSALLFTRVSCRLSKWLQQMSCRLSKWPQQILSYYFIIMISMSLCIVYCKPSFISFNFAFCDSQVVKLLIIIVTKPLYTRDFKRTSAMRQIFVMTSLLIAWVMRQAVFCCFRCLVLSGSILDLNPRFSRCHSQRWFKTLNL